MRRKVGYLDASGGFVARGDEEVAHQREEEGDEQSTYGTPELVSVMRIRITFAGWLFVFFSLLLCRVGGRASSSSRGGRPRRRSSFHCRSSTPGRRATSGHHCTRASARACTQASEMNDVFGSVFDFFCMKIYLITCARTCFSFYIMYAYYSCCCCYYSCCCYYCY